jgi:hypothetical protein
MSCTETETVVTSTDLDSLNLEIRSRKTARIADSLQLLSTNVKGPIKRCRRHSYAFRCPENEVDEFGDEVIHYEDILLVKVCPFCGKTNSSWIYYLREWTLE